MSSTPDNQFEYQGDRAEAYESMRVHDDKWEREQEAVALLLAEASAGLASILDVPVGTGRFLALFARRNDSVLGLDISEDMLAEARSRLEGLGRHSIELAVGDITRLDLQERSYDVCLCIRLLNIVPEGVVVAALSELARVSRKHVIIGVRTYDVRGVPYQMFARARSRLSGRPRKVVPRSRRGLLTMLDRAGLDVERSVAIHEGRYGSSRYDHYLLKVRRG